MRVRFPSPAPPRRRGKPVTGSPRHRVRFGDLRCRQGFRLSGEWDPPLDPARDTLISARWFHRWRPVASRCPAPRAGPGTRGRCSRQARTWLGSGSVVCRITATAPKSGDADYGGAGDDGGFALRQRQPRWEQRSDLDIGRGRHSDRVAAMGVGMPSHRQRQAGGTDAGREPSDQPKGTRGTLAFRAHCAGSIPVSRYTAV